MKIYLIDFNTETFKIEANIVEIDYKNLDEQYDQLVKLLNSVG